MMSLPMTGYRNLEDGDDDGGDDTDANDDDDDDVDDDDTDLVHFVFVCALFVCTGCNVLYKIEIVIVVSCVDACACVRVDAYVYV
jgi:hypothetical protein